MTRQEKIQLIQQLHRDTQDGVAMPDEYTIGKFDFLVSEGFELHSGDYMNKAKSEYQYELINMVHNDKIVRAHTANEMLINMQNGRYSKYQLEYLHKKCKIIALKEFMRTEPELIFKP